MRILDADFFQGFQTVHGKAGADQIECFEAVAAHLFEGFIGIGLQPGFASEAGLVGHQPLLRHQLKPFGDGLRALPALLRIGIAALGETLRNAVEGKQQALAAPVQIPMVADARFHGIQPGRMPVVFADETQIRHAFLFQIVPGDGIEHRGGGGGRILRVQRQHSQLLQIRIVGQHRGHRRIAVTHRQPDLGIRHLVLQFVGQTLRVHQQRRAFRQPDLGVVAGHAARANRQNDEMQQDAPQPAAEIDHAVIVQEFGQIATDRARGRGIRRSQIDQQDQALAVFHRHGLNFRR